MRHLQHWIDPPLFATDYERAIDIREGGTTEWLFQHPKFEVWRKSGISNEEISERTLWIHGKPYKSPPQRTFYGLLRCRNSMD